MHNILLTTFVQSGRKSIRYVLRPLYRLASAISIGAIAPLYKQEVSSLIKSVEVYYRSCACYCARALQARRGCRELCWPHPPATGYVVYGVFGMALCWSTQGGKRANVDNHLFFVILLV